MKNLEIKIIFKLPESDNILSLLESIGYNEFKEKIKEFDSKIDYKCYYDKALSIEKIHFKVSKFFNIEKDLILSKSRNREIVNARQIAMVFCRFLIKPQPLLKTIGEYFGKRNHATVTHSLITIQNQIDTDKKFSEQFEEIKNFLLT